MRKVPFTRQFGFELEFNNRCRGAVTQARLKRAIETVRGETATINGYSRQNNNRDWVVKTDASCGWEVASRVMSSSEDLKKAAQAVQAMYRAGAQVNRSCGLHVHVEVVDFTKSQVATMIQWWVKFERFVSDVLDPSRKNNMYCRRVGKNFSGNRSYGTDETLRSNNGRNALNTARICWSSSSSARHRVDKRVEFRIAHGTNDFVDLKNWVRFLLTFVEFSKEAYKPPNVNYLLPREALETLGLLDENVSNSVVEMRTWLLDSALKNAEHELDRKLIRATQNQLSED